MTVLEHGAGGEHEPLLEPAALALITLVASAALFVRLRVWEPFQ